MIRRKSLISVTIIGGAVSVVVYLSVFGASGIDKGVDRQQVGGRGQRSSERPLVNRRSTRPSMRPPARSQLPEPFKGRQRRLESKCRALFTKNARRIIWAHFPRNQMIIDAKRNFGYCAVEKAGSTFWKSVFARLIGKLAQINSGDDDIDTVQSKDEIHEIFLYKLKHYARQNAEKFLKRANLMLFVRDPFSRLLSAYMDKLLSPNYHYWSTIGTMIVANQRVNFSANALRCGHDVTFKEFLEYFVASERKPSVPKDHHWRPIWRLCQPCGIPYQYIGKQETFATDAKFIFKLLSPNSTEFPNDINRLDFIINDVRRIVNDVIDHFELYKKCLSLQELLQRLYSLFVFKGYLKDIVSIKTAVLSNVNISQAEETQILHDFSHRTIAEIRNTLDLGIVDDRRLRNSMGWYHNLPQGLRMDVYKHIHPDVVLFGYEKLVNIYLQQSSKGEDS